MGAIANKADTWTQLTTDLYHCENKVFILAKYLVTIVA